MAKKLARFISSVALVVGIPTTAFAAAPPECTSADMAGLAQAKNVSYQSVGYDAGSIDRFFGDAVSHPSPENYLTGIITGAEIDYPFDSMDRFGFSLKIVVGANGRVSCIALAPLVDGDPRPQWTPQRREWAGYISTWRYQPYRSKGKSVAVIGRVDVTEYELPKAHVPMPAGDEEKVIIIQDMPYFGYHLELHGDGKVIYTSIRGNHPGTRIYHVDRSTVAYVLKEAESADFWSLRDVYPRHPKNPKRYDSRIQITLGGITKSLTDYGDSDSGLSREAHFLAYGIRHWIDLK